MFPTQRPATPTSTMSPVAPSVIPPPVPQHADRPTRSLLASAVASVVGALVMLSACGSGGDATATPVSPPTSDVASTPSTILAPPTSPADDRGDGDDPGGEPDVSGLEAVRRAVIQVEATGSFVDPEFGAVEGAGRGSGFVISDDGLAVTNNHVVTGAGLLHVWVADEEEPRNARVVGVSECSDLAVIQIDGPQIPHVEWVDSIGDPGTEVYVAGFPLGDPEYTLTRGVIAKARANGDTNWASVDHTIEHDAAAQPGNSGGPLVTADGRVAGVHYASAVQTNQSQFLAIAADVAKPIVDELARGIDVDSVGINGQIVTSEDGELAGMWVAGVASGSPADEAGVEPGDIVTRIEGVSIGRDGTMADYCDVLRSHGPGDQLAIEVLRFATSEVLEGELNGDWLTPSFSFADEYADGSDTTADQVYDDYVSVADDTGSIQVSIPTAWADVDTTPTDLGNGVGSPSIIASTDIARYNEAWDVPGVVFVASDSLLAFTPSEMLDLAAPAECSSEGRDAYDDGFFVGEYEVFSGCGDTGTQVFVVATTSADGAYGVLVAVQVVGDADLAALDTILQSFNVVV